MNIGGVRLSELYKKITLEQNRNSKFLVLGTQIFVLVLFIVIWEILANQRCNRQLYNE